MSATVAWSLTGWGLDAKHRPIRMTVPHRHTGRKCPQHLDEGRCACPFVAEHGPRQPISAQTTGNAPSGQSSADALGVPTDRPAPYWGWGTILDRYGRLWREDNGEDDPPAPPAEMDDIGRRPNRLIAISDHESTITSAITPTEIAEQR